jgi:protein O-mannosyl-transferase
MEAREVTIGAGSDVFGRRSGVEDLGFAQTQHAGRVARLAPTCPAAQFARDVINSKVKRDQRKAARPQPKIQPKSDLWQRYSVHAPLLAVILVALAAYSNSFHGPFLLDNKEAMLQDTRVHTNTGDNVARIFRTPYHQTLLSGLYRPVTTWTYLLNYAILGSGTAPESYHWLNFLLHAFNIVLVYCLALALFEDRTAALAASALWGLHPVLTESVTNIIGRADMLSATGVLGALLCYWVAARAKGARQIVAIAGVALAAGVAVWSKESGVVAIALLPLFDWIFLRGLPGRARAAAIGAAAIPMALYFVVRAGVLARFPVGPTPYTDNPLIGAPFLAAQLTAFRVIAKYFGLLVWPARLSADYSYSEIPAAVSAMGYFGLALCIAAAALALWAWRRHKPLFFAILLFFIALAPVANVFLRIGTVMAERFLYLPAVGFILAVVYGLRAVLERAPQRRNAVAYALGLVLVLLAARTYNRNSDWNDEQRFWESVTENAPGSYKGHIGLASKLPLIRRADRDRAAAEIARTVAILDPLPDAQNAPLAYRMAGSIYRNMGDQIALHRAERDGTQPHDWYQKALVVLFRSQAMELARDLALRDLNAKRGTPSPTFLPADLYFEIGRTYLRDGQQLQALSFYERGRDLGTNADLLEDEGGTFESFGDYRKAAQRYIEALEVDSSRNDLTPKIAEMYKKAEPNGCGIAPGGGLNLQCPMVHEDICGAARNVEDTFTRHGQPEDAAQVRRLAIIDLGCTGIGGK